VSKAPKYEGLRADRIIVTLQKLQERVSQRFPGSGLSRVCVELIETARWSSEDAARVSRPNWFWRIVLFVVIASGVAAQIAAARFLHVDGAPANAIDLLQGLDSAAPCGFC
jgi:hypothetical protein